MAVCVMASGGLIAFAHPAGATFPGRNGRIAFSTGFDGFDPALTSQIFTVRPDGSGLRRLTNVGRGHHAVSPAFSPDGRRIAYYSDVSGNYEIWVMDADGGHKTRLTHDERFVNLRPRWSPDGSAIVFSRCTSQFDFQCHITRMRANGSGITRLTNGHWVDGNPVFSPDGSRIAFDSNRKGLQSAVWVMKANGTDLRKLTRADLEAVFPDWSPDGAHITFSTNCCRPVGTNQWVMRADGSRPHPLTHVGSEHNAGVGVYAPNGRKLVLISDIRYPDRCCNDLMVMNADGSSLHPIVTTQPTVLFSDWGPAA
jgi:TolB protein